MARRDRYLAASLVSLAAVLVFVRTVYPRWLGVSPHYQPCVEAMEAVRPGQSVDDAERRIRRAVTEGAQRVSDGAPGLPVPLSCTSPEPAAAVTVWCERYEGDLLESDTEEGSLSRDLDSWRAWGRIVTNGSFTHSRFDIYEWADLVTGVRAADCLIAPIDTYECRDRNRPPDWWPLGARPDAPR